jgi:hypothetical protein
MVYNCMGKNKLVGQHHSLIDLGILVHYVRWPKLSVPFSGVTFFFSLQMVQYSYEISHRLTLCDTCSFLALADNRKRTILNACAFCDFLTTSNVSLWVPVELAYHECDLVFAYLPPWCHINIYMNQCLTGLARTNHFHQNCRCDWIQAHLFDFCCKSITK